MQKNLLSIYLIVFGFSCFAQNFSYNIQLQSVSFDGVSMYTLREDDGIGFLPDENQWQIDETPSAVAYKSGSLAEVEATFLLTCANLPTEVFVRGFGNDGINFEEKSIAVSSATIIYPATTASLAFENEMVQFFDPFTITWQISFNGIDWFEAGQSQNRVYVTLQAPKPESTWSGFKYYETLFYLSCKNAHGATSNDEVIDLIWADFTDHSVNRVDGEPLKYYEDIFSPNVSLPSLLKYADAECYTWAMLYLALLKIQGFSQTNNYMNITSNYASSSCGSISRFVVKTWTFETPSNDCTDLPYINVYAADYFSADTAYRYDYAEVIDQIGLIGQTEPNPASSFGNHQIAIVNDKYYDASYGVLYDTFEDIKYGAISGWSRTEESDELGISIDVNGDGDLDGSPNFTILRVTSDLEMADFDPSIESW